MQRTQINFVLNGQPTNIETAPDRTLLDVLRQDLGLTGTKKGCDDEGLCGACTVLIDGKARRACRTPVQSILGKRVETIEGLALLTGLHPLQQAFIDHGAVQCGFCTPGALLSAKALLDGNLNPTRQEIAHAIHGNLCRCTGYVKIVDAVEAAAAVLRGEPAPPTASFRAGQPPLGGDLRRLEDLDKVTGKAKFAADISLPDMLHVKVLRSPHPYARILKIDIETALRLPGVVSVITAGDIPGVASFSDLWGSKDDGVPTKNHPTTALEPVLAHDLVRMRGEPVALVVGVDERNAQAALEAVRVDYQPLEPVFDPQQALGEGAPSLHSGGNLYEYGEIKKGYPNQPVEPAEIEVELDFSLATQDHVALEPQSLLAYHDEQGCLVVVGPTHQPHARKLQIARMLDLDPQRIRLIVPPMGGSFGSRHHFWPLLAIALCAYRTGQPVKLVYSRAEVFEASLKRHAFTIHCHMGARRDGRLAHLRARAYGNAGPYGGAPTIAEFVALCGSGPYDWQTIDYECRVAHTNWANAGPFRGYGMPQGVLGLECTLDEVAKRLGIDPLEIRYLNRTGGAELSATGQPFDEPFAYKQVLDAIQPIWRALQDTTRQLQQTAGPHERYGVGLATNWYQYGKSGSLAVSAQAGLDQAGRIVLYYTAYTAGNGSETVISQIASQELGVPRDEIYQVNNDTGQTLETKITGACRTAYWVGGAVQQAARRLKSEILAIASEILGAPAERLRHTGRQVFDLADPGQAISLAQVADALQERRGSARFTGTLSLEERFPQRDPRFHQLGQFVCGAAIAQVHLDLTTGKTSVLRVAVAQDVGRALNPLDISGQIEGAVVMDVGSALMEEHIPGQTLDFKRYPIPRSKDAPQIEVILVEVAGTDGPYGAKGAGEAVMGHTRAAILNAISDAAGVRITQVPVTPARLKAALLADTPT